MFILVITIERNTRTSHSLRGDKAAGSEGDSIASAQSLYDFVVMFSATQAEPGTLMDVNGISVPSVLPGM
jgi:hypothetical protein